MSQDVVLLVIIVVAVIAFLIIGSVTYSNRGAVGESIVSTLLSSLDKTKYNVINNLVLEQNGKTTQIDHIVIGECGVFVIETKNYSGWIFGGEAQEYWTQVIYKHKQRFYNPIRQNLGHIWALRKIIREPQEIKYISLIVFTGSATLKVKTVTQVIKASVLLHCIKSRAEVNLTLTARQKLFAELNAFNISDRYDAKAHFSSVKRNIQKRQELIRQSKCPRCGNELVKREGKHGAFFGCKGFPRCKFISNICAKAGVLFAIINNCIYL